MEITVADKSAYWHQIRVNTSANNNGRHARAPWPLQLQVAALVANDDIKASIATFDGTTPTTWTVSLITEASGQGGGLRLIRVRMEFDAEQYDLEQDNGAAEPLAPKVEESWVRRLSDIESIDIKRARMRPNSFGRVMENVLDVADVRVTFRGGAVIDLGIDQLAMTVQDDRRPSDVFVELLRGHTGL
ncbi:hypothetical protein [Mycolicibacterium canariasense]|uniref:hypothetical protein n=1 Tax=Mycolicibacterium canariasense TaxID=228230 RepID=UPI0032D582A0